MITAKIQVPMLHAAQKGAVKVTASHHQQGLARPRKRRFTGSFLWTLRVNLRPPETPQGTTGNQESQIIAL